MMTSTSTTTGYAAYEHDRSGRCVRHPEVKLRRRKKFKKWSSSRRLRYCPCCVMDYLLAMDPDGKGQLMMHGPNARLQLVRSSSTNSTASATSSSAEESTTRAHEVEKESTPRDLSADTAVNKPSEEKCDNSHDSFPFQRHQQQQLREPVGHEMNTNKPPINDIVCTNNSVSWDHASSIDDNLSWGQHIGDEIEREQQWLFFLDTWQREKDDFRAEITALKNENRQLSNSMKYMKKWLKKSSKHEHEICRPTVDSISESQELYREILRQQGDIIQSLKDDIKCASSDHLMGMEDVVRLLQQQVEALEVEKEASRSMYENEIDVLQQELKSIQARHSESMLHASNLKSALGREKEHNKTLLVQFEKIEKERRSNIEHQTEKVDKFKQTISNLDANLKEEMVKDEVIRTKLAYKTQRHKEEKKQEGQ